MFGRAEGPLLRETRQQLVRLRLSPLNSGLVYFKTIHFIINPILMITEQEDVRLAIFQSFLTEDWEASTLVVFLRARGLISMPPPVTYIQYPLKEGGKGEATCWLCLAKSSWIADLVLGQRTPEVAKRFEEILQAAAVQVICSLPLTVQPVLALTSTKPA